ncbi:two-component response regulator-like APRR3 [Pistacia vera]|uniref:two-component response regulator-like APRR3 n=1 Tax=Pistacia vera TaxID=55513 RepID=UPI001263329F|nr:two-component response regulator-like APRR3 [Pistacia vera]
MRMGEVVLSSEEAMEMELETEKNETMKDGSSEGVRWERFMPRMVLRVLLVEADDSTRHIISALLRKCSYRVVAVPDGLTAWETLKGQPHNIDLVLTEVELPSISGFALLTLVMEHDICKKIPVIMMSSHDSISMVLKCMLKGAADFLIKPVRRNELRNLWQHVWRRHSLLGGHVPQKLPVIRHKAEATSENNASSSRSSDTKQKSKENSEKGSVAQSSCTSPYLEVESAYMQNMQGLSYLNGRSTSDSNNEEREKLDECIKLEKGSVMLDSNAGEKFASGSEFAPCSGAYTSTPLRVEENYFCFKPMSHGDGVRPGNDRENAYTTGVHGCNDELIEQTRGAIDLIGTFDNRPNSISGQSTFNDGMNKFEFAPQLELSLRKIFSSCSKEPVTDERHALNHSTASAFSRYNNSKTLPTSASNFPKLKDDTCKSREILSSQLSENATGNSQPHGATSSNSQENMTFLGIGQSGQSEVTFARPQLGFIPVPGVRFDNIGAGYTHVFPPVFYTQSGLPPACSPKSPCQREQSPFPSCTSVHSNPDVHDLEGHRQSDETINNSIDQTVCEQNNVESLEELRRSSAAAGQSTCSSLCNGLGNINNAGTYGGFSNRMHENATLSEAVEKGTAPENLNGTLFIHGGFRNMDCHRSSRREAALTKFRLKRKDRCFEKKVRYQSRKSLAEQRPRVKGQFVRQVRDETTSTAANGNADGS